MLTMIKLIKSFLNDERGLTATEYALCAALVSVAIIAAFTLLGTNIAATINTVAAAI